MPQYKRNLFILCIAIFLAAVSWSQIVPFLPLFLREMGVKRNLLQWSGIIFAVQSLASIVMLPFWGKLGDKYGQKPMAIRAGIFLTAIYFGMSVCRTPWQLALLRFFNGALTGFIPGSIALIATNTPKALAARSVATAQSASAAGQIVGPALGGLMVAAPFLGYRGSMQVSGVAVLVSTIMVWRLVVVENKPEPAEKTSLLQDFATSLRSPVISSTMLAVMLASTLMALMQPFLALHLAKIGAQEHKWLMGVVFAMPPLAFMLSAQPWTRFGERVGFDRSLRGGMVGAALCAIALAFAGNIWLFSLVFFALGVCLAAVHPAAGAILCTRVEESFRGRAYGMLYSGAFLGAFLAPLAGSAIASMWGIASVFVFGGLVLTFGLLLFTALARKWPKAPAL